MGRLEYISEFPDPNCRENHHVGEAATISKPLDEKAVEFLKTWIRSGCKRIKELRGQALYFSTMLPLRMKKRQNLTGGNSDQTTKK